MPNINKNKKYHFIYKTTNQLNGKYYIGMHSTSNLKDGYVGSGTRLKRAIKKYGIKNFKFEILEYCDTRELLVEREKRIVNIDLLNDELCLNLVCGGIGGFTPEVARKGAIASNKKQRTLIDTDPEWVKRRFLNMSQSRKGRVSYWKGKPGHFKGKKHSADTISKMSASRKGKSTKELNSQFGTCWINKNNVYKKIPLSTLASFLNEGWTRGRSGYKHKGGYYGTTV